LQDAKAAGALHKLAAGEPSYRVEAEVFRSLGKIKDRSSPGFLEAALDRPSHNDMIRIAIYQALGQLEEADSWPVLVAGAEYGAPRLSRGAAMMAMAKLAKRYEHLKGEALECFRRFATESRGTPAAVFRGKLWAIQAMQSLDDLAAVPVLRKLADNEADGRLRRRARDAVTALFDSARKPGELKIIRDDLDTWVKESKSFRDRLEKLEKTGKKKK
jgi:HEAT repeat protein